MKILLINRLIVSLIEPPLNIFFRFFCFAAEGLYNDDAIGGDGPVYRTLCDLCIRLDGSPSCEDLSIVIMQNNNQFNLHYFIHDYVKK